MIQNDLSMLLENNYNPKTNSITVLTTDERELLTRILKNK
jgi:hypothetical protein